MTSYFIYNLNLRKSNNQQLYEKYSAYKNSRVTLQKILNTQKRLKRKEEKRIVREKRIAKKKAFERQRYDNYTGYKQYNNHIFC